MDTPQQNVPLTLLREIERRSQRVARGLPLQVEVKPRWRGTGFRLGEIRLVAALSEMHEIFTYPALSRIPGAKHWVRGVANIRSSLLPVVDMKDWLGMGVTSVTPASRVLAVRHGDVYVGFLVDEVLGLKHFLLQEERVDMVPYAESALNAYLQGAFLREGQYWGVFSLQALVGSPVSALVA
jgi:twitching motility protein PilI